MKKSSKIITLLLILVFAVINCITVSASAYSDFEKWLEPYAEEEQRRINEVLRSPNNEDKIGVFKENVPIDNAISTYANCLKCAALGVTVCAKEGTVIDEGYHRALLGLIETDCYVTYLGSRGASMCPICGSVLEKYGVHYCWEVHKKCYKGTYDTCPMRIS